MYCVHCAGINEHFICCGYAIDLLVMLSNKSDFTYAVHLVEDGQYGAIEVVKLIFSLFYLICSWL